MLALIVWFCLDLHSSSDGTVGRRQTRLMWVLLRMAQKPSLRLVAAKSLIGLPRRVLTEFGRYSDDIWTMFGRGSGVPRLDVAAGDSSRGIDGRKPCDAPSPSALTRG